jgi:SAM-dependent methyltransferase
MDEEFESPNCIICGKQENEVFLRGAGLAHIVRCRNDGLLYMNPRPTEEALQKLNISLVRENNLFMFNDYRREILQREAQAIRRVKPEGNLLDVGCATGSFFENFSHGGWRLYGVDISPLGVEQSRAKYDAQVSCGTLREVQYPARFFDVVTVLDTIFYSPNPRVELAEIHRILKDDGLLAMEIPGVRYTLWREKGLLCWLLDRKWMRGLTNSLHLYYFSPLTISLLLESTGFRVLKMIPEQASLGQRGITRAVNNLHFAAARLLFRLSGGRLSIAGKELYLAVKR